MTTYNQASTQDRIQALTGGATTDIDEALDQWENERELSKQCEDEIQALTIHAQITLTTLEAFDIVLPAIEQEAGMFLSQTLRDKITSLHNSLSELNSSKKHLKELLRGVKPQ
jgi:hypothetical protein